ncbi:MAG TPA: hypothetical protein VK154_09665 [Chitinophagales bacterium]|nr:hypothetical protein [Chitinophagales bacterium]
MLEKNMDEYKQIRVEMESVRACLRQYISYSLGGAGIIYLSVNNYVPMNKAADRIDLALVYMFSAALISAFFHLSLYKFNSLNRYSGYCKLISLETSIEETVQTEGKEGIEGSYPVKKGDKESWPKYFVFWEVCVAKLYNAFYPNEITNKHYNSLQFKFEGTKGFDKIAKLKEMFEQYKLERPTSDDGALKSGLKLLTPRFINFIKHEPVKSWKYPLYTAGIFYIIILFFFCLAVLSLLQSRKNIEFSLNFNSAITAKFFVLFTLTLIVIWILFRSLYEIHSLMRGSKTASAYCWKFIIFRIKVLNSIGVMPTYYFTDRELNH